MILPFVLCWHLPPNQHIVIIVNLLMETAVLCFTKLYSFSHSYGSVLPYATDDLVTYTTVSSPNLAPTSFPITDFLPSELFVLSFLTTCRFATFSFFSTYSKRTVAHQYLVVSVAVVFPIHPTVLILSFSALTYLYFSTVNELPHHEYHLLYLQLLFWRYYVYSSLPTLDHFVSILFHFESSSFQFLHRPYSKIRLKFGCSISTRAIDAFVLDSFVTVLNWSGRKCSSPSPKVLYTKSI
jgi:hypothetical protein